MFWIRTRAVCHLPQSTHSQSRSGLERPSAKGRGYSSRPKHPNKSAIIPDNPNSTKSIPRFFMVRTCDIQRALSRCDLGYLIWDWTVDGVPPEAGIWPTCRRPLTGGTANDKCKTHSISSTLAVQGQSLPHSAAGSPVHLLTCSHRRSGSRRLALLLAGDVLHDLHKPHLNFV